MSHWGVRFIYHSRCKLVHVTSHFACGIAMIWICFYMASHILEQQTLHSSVETHPVYIGSHLPRFLRCSHQNMNSFQFYISLEKHHYSGFIVQAPNTLAQMINQNSIKGPWDFLLKVIENKFNQLTNCKSAPLTLVLQVTVVPCRWTNDSTVCIWTASFS